MLGRHLLGGDGLASGGKKATKKTAGKGLEAAAEATRNALDFSFELSGLGGAGQVTDAQAMALCLWSAAVQFGQKVLMREFRSMEVHSWCVCAPLALLPSRGPSVASTRYAAD